MAADAEVTIPPTDMLGLCPPVLNLCEMIPREAEPHRDLKTLVNLPFHYSTTL